VHGRRALPAKEGQSYKSILNYYYTGITFSKIDDSKQSG